MVVHKFLKSYLRRIKFMTLHPETHLLPVIEHCSLNQNFQCFQGNPLNRLNLHRKSLADLVQHPQSRFLAYRQLKVLFNQEKKQLSWLKYENLFSYENESHLKVDQCELVLLGITSKYLADRPSTLLFNEPTKLDPKILNQCLLASEPNPEEYIYFVLSIPATFPDVLPGKFMDLRPLVPQLSVIEAAVSGQGRALLDWHSCYQYCGKCGSSTKSMDGGTRRKCLKCTNAIYPRTDPVAITLVIHLDNEHVLLGRKASFPPCVYSCLAGFMEPGESIYEACTREVWEESGIVVDTHSTRYFDSQPWPFLGGQLMIGCYAHAVDETITLHDSELEDCRWFSRAEIGDMIEQSLKLDLDKNNQNFRIPPPTAIAHQLITSWHSKTMNQSSQ